MLKNFEANELKKKAKFVFWPRKGQTWQLWSRPAIWYAPIRTYPPIRGPYGPTRTTTRTKNLVTTVRACVWGGGACQVNKSAPPSAPLPPPIPSQGWLKVNKRLDRGAEM